MSSTRHALPEPFSDLGLRLTLTQGHPASAASSHCMEQSTEHAGFQVIGRIPGAEPLPQSVRERTKGGEAPATAAGRAAFLRFKARINHVGA
jgi:hypothetical protein